MQTAVKSRSQKKTTTNNSLFARGNNAFIQPKLNINKPNDKHEVEADNVAHKVVNRINDNFFTPNTPSFFSPQPAIQKQFDPEVQKQEESENEIQEKPIAETITPLVQRESEEEIQEKSLLEEIQPKLLQRQEDDELQTKSNGENTAPSNIESQLSNSKGGGSPLSNDTQSQMGAGFGTDFNNVRVHTDSNAVQMSRDMGAQAFTHGNDIYFNEGKYNTESNAGKHLLAHELTHTVQQGATVQAKEEDISTTGKKVQRGMLDRLGSFIGDIRSRVINFVRSLPGYYLITVLLGRDPLTDERVDRNGSNILRGLLLLLPNGQQKYDKLVQEGAIERSAAWIDQQFAEISAIQSQASSALDEAIDSLGPTDVVRPGAALERIRGIINPVISRARNYAGRVVRQIVQFLKDALLNSLVNFIKNRTRGYPLLRVLLGRDPVTDEEVPGTMENVIHAFLMLSESGEAYYNRMMETRALPDAIDWMREQIATLPSAAEVIAAFTNAWGSVSFEDLLQPIAAFERIYNILNDPIGRILNFVGAVTRQIFIFIKDAMLGWLKSNADEIPGYHLVTVLINKDVFTQEVVPRTTTNIIRGFMGLIPGGEAQFQQMRESGVIPRLANRINNAINRLGITWSFIRNLFISLWDSMSITDLLLPLVAFARIIARFREPIGRLFAFIRVVIRAIVEVMLRMMNFPIDLIGQIIDNAMQAYEDIKRDPIGFLKNLMRAAKRGFQQFFNNFVSHLIGGVRGWLFAELQSAGIEPPQDITFRSILGMAMRVLGITVDNIFERLARRIGQQRVDRIRSMMDRLTGIWEFVRDVIDRGAVAIWERIQNQLSNLWDTIVDGIRNWIVTRIVQRMTARLLTMLDPTGIMTVVNGFVTFFRAVQSFIEQLTRILQVINSFVMGVGQIARGNIQQAANFLENALARALPVAIAFLANQVGLRGLGSRVSEMIGRARETINSGIDWLIERAMRLGSAILNRLTGRGNQEHSPETQARIDEGVQAITTEEQRVAQNGKVSREGADQVASNIRRNHPVFTSFIVVDGGDSWNYRYTASAAEDVDTPTTKPDDESNGMRNTSPGYGGLTNGFGKSVHVQFLALNAQGGSEADSSLTNEHYELLDKRLHIDGRAGYYIRGHLLNNHLGGPGNDWKNLTPLKRSVNSQHHSKFETHVKTAVGIGESNTDNHRQVKNFDVTADYGRGPDAKIADLINGSRDFPELENKEFTARELGEVMRAEQYVPVRLVCSAMKMNPETNEGEGEPVAQSDPVTIEQNIDYGDIDAYRLGMVTRRRRYNLRLVFNNANGDENAFINDILSNLPDLPEVAKNNVRRIYTHFQTNDSVSGSQYRALFGVTKTSIENNHPNIKLVGRL